MQETCYRIQAPLRRTIALLSDLHDRPYGRILIAVARKRPDLIAVPGDTPAETIAAIIADEAAIGMVNNKTTAVRLLPSPGKQVGDTVEMGGLLGSAPVMPVHSESSADFIARGGRIPAPLHSLRN